MRPKEDPNATHLPPLHARWNCCDRCRRDPGGLLEGLVRLRRRRRRLLPQLQARVGAGLQGHRGRLHQEDRCERQGRHRRFRHLRADPEVRGRQVQPAHAVQPQRPCGLRQLEGLRLRPVRRRLHQADDGRVPGPQGRRGQGRGRTAGHRGLRHHLQRRHPQEVLRYGGRQGHLRRPDQGLRQAQGGRRGHAGQEGRPRYRGRLRRDLAVPR